MADYGRNRSSVFKLNFPVGIQTHGATGQFLVSTTNWQYTTNHKLADIMARYWASFIITHDLNPLRHVDAPFWPSYVSGGKGTIASGESVGFSILHVTDTSTRVVSDPDASPQCDFFAAQGYRVRN